CVGFSRRAPFRRNPLLKGLKHYGGSISRFVFKNKERTAFYHSRANMFALASLAVRLLGETHS
ncbi:hypothetical protein, partial [Halalkalibacter flavus]|uniref:hypothetical protein n=1 Tax=Halalkalibacter flavus TaxID=3090668 RepID=UPI002FC9B2AF